MSIELQHRRTFHLVTQASWQSHDPTTAYRHASLVSEGFIHCTVGVDELAVTANRHYSDETGPMVALELDMQLLGSPVQCNDPAGIYPHVHGPIDPSAIIAVIAMPRSVDGAWLPPVLP